MQSVFTLKGNEIDFTVDALQAAANKMCQTMARPYREIVKQIDQTRNYGNGKEARISLTGGYIDCMDYAVKAAMENQPDNKAIGEAVLSRMRKKSKGLGYVRYM